MPIASACPSLSFLTHSTLSLFACTRTVPKPAHPSQSVGQSARNPPRRLVDSQSTLFAPRDPAQTFTLCLHFESDIGRKCPDCFALQVWQGPAKQGPSDATGRIGRSSARSRGRGASVGRFPYLVGVCSASLLGVPSRLEDASSKNIGCLPRNLDLIPSALEITCQKCTDQPDLT